MKGAQLPLAVQLRVTSSFDTYFSGPNVEAVAALRGLDTPVLIFGAPNSGRTHLLQAACRHHGGAYVPLNELRDYGPDVLAGYGGDPLFLDDLDAVGKDADWCVTLARLIDTLRTQGMPFALSAPAAPDRLVLARPDLRTRLSQCTVFGLQPLDDADRRALLLLRAKARGLELPDDVSRWLLNHHARDTASLIDAIDTLDRAALTRKRRLTLPLAQAALADASAHTAPD